MMLREEREQIVEFGVRMVKAGLTTGTGGNLSVVERERGLVAVTPSGVRYQEITAEDVVLTDLAGKVVEGRLRPSSELPFHLALYEHYPETQAVVHTHSVYATTMACLGWALPAVHYLVAWAGPEVPVAPYATFGSAKLAANIVRTMAGCRAIFLANHGLVSVGEGLEQAFNIAGEIEFVSRVYLQTRMVGSPVILPEAEIAAVMEKFRNYGQKKPLPQVDGGRGATSETDY